MNEQSNVWQDAINGLRAVGLSDYADILLKDTQSPDKRRRQALSNILNCLRIRSFLGDTTIPRNLDPLRQLLVRAFDAVPVMRNRDGKQVRVPEEWVGRFPTHLTKVERKAQAMVKRKHRRKRLREEARFDAKQREA